TVGDHYRPWGMAGRRGGDQGDITTAVRDAVFQQPLSGKLPIAAAAVINAPVALVVVPFEAHTSAVLQRHGLDGGGAAPATAAQRQHQLHPSVRTGFGDHAPFRSVAGDDRAAAVVIQSVAETAL